MTETRNIIMSGARVDHEEPGQRLATLLILIAIAGVMSLSGCAVSPDTMAPSPAPQTTSGVKAAAAKAQNASPAGQSLQELSVREERGQTTLLVKFSQAVTQYRHFPLPVPARIVLDIFTNVSQPGQADLYRIDTSTVATLRVNQVEGGLRLTTDIAGATVPPYTITTEDGGLRIVIGAENPNATAKKDATVVRGGVRADIRTPEASTAAAPGATKPLGTDKVPGEDKKYTGQKIS